MCCGNNRVAARAAVTAGRTARSTAGEAHSPGPMSTIMLEYLGGGEASIRGPVSGRLYWFARRGARVRVDPRDRPGLEARPTLRLVR